MVDGVELVRAAPAADVGEAAIELGRDGSIRTGRRSQMTQGLAAKLAHATGVARVAPAGPDVVALRLVHAARARDGGDGFWNARRNRWAGRGGGRRGGRADRAVRVTAARGGEPAEDEERDRSTLSFTRPGAVAFQRELHDELPPRDFANSPASTHAMRRECSERAATCSSCGSRTSRSAPSRRRARLREARESSSGVRPRNSGRSCHAACTAKVRHCGGPAPSVIEPKPGDARIVGLKRAREMLWAVPRR